MVTCASAGMRRGGWRATEVWADIIKQTATRGSETVFCRQKGDGITSSITHGLLLEALGFAAFAAPTQRSEVGSH